MVTLTLDALRDQGFAVSRTIVLHTNPEVPPVKKALNVLESEEKFYNDQGFPVVFEFRPFKESGYFPKDIYSEEDAALILRVLYQELAKEKRRGHRVHLSLSGGRKVITAMGMVVAQLLLGEEDHVWHLLSIDRLQESRAMHARHPNEIKLIPIPVLRWSLLPSTVHELLIWDDPYRAIQRQRELKEKEQLKLLEHFWATLTPTEREVVTVLVRERASNTALAQNLKRSPKTIANHLQNIYTKYRECLGLPEKTAVRMRLVADLAPVVNELEKIDKHS